MISRVRLKLVVWQLRLIRRQVKWLKRYTAELSSQAVRLASR